MKEVTRNDIDALFEEEEVFFLPGNLAETIIETDFPKAVFLIHLNGFPFADYENTLFKLISSCKLDKQEICIYSYVEAKSTSVHTILSRFTPCPIIILGQAPQPFSNILLKGYSATGIKGWHIVQSHNLRLLEEDAALKNTPKYRNFKLKLWEQLKLIFKIS